MILATGATFSRVDVPGGITLHFDEVTAMESPSGRFQQDAAGQDE